MSQLAKTLNRRRNAREVRLRSRMAERGQVAIVLVLGIVLMMVLGTSIFVATSIQSFPLVQSNLSSHDAYRGLQAGLNEYLYLVNVDPNRVQCTSTNTAGTCASMAPFKFETWNAVPNTGLNGAPTEWFAIHNPVLNSANKTVDLTIDGAAQAGAGFQIETASVDLKQANNFLTNAWWSVHGIIDPSVIGNFGSCKVDAAGPNNNQLNLAWGNGGTYDPTTGGNYAPGVAGYNGAYPYSNSCISNNLAWNPPGTFFDGPIFSDDPLFVCSFGVANTGPTDTSQNDTTWVGSPPNFLPINTADPNEKWTSEGCGYPPYSASNPYSATNDTGTLAPVYNVPLSQPNPIHTPPLNIVGSTALTNQALADGCLYEGPTQITFEGTNGLKIVSPDTPTGGTSGTNDALITSTTNKSTCLPTSPGGFVPLPDNGVIFVSTYNPGGGKSCPNNHANPLVGKYPGKTTFANCEGDALVGNAYYDMTSDPTLPLTYNPNSYKNNVGLSGALTIGANNDAVIMNDITYDDCGAALPGDTAGSCPINPSGTTNDILGLIAANYVTVNHPIIPGGSGADEPICDGYGSGPNGDLNVAKYSGALCDLYQPRIDAVTLALAHSFGVNNFDTGAALGTINVDGVIAEYFADLDGATYNLSGGAGSYNTGYNAVHYHWDSRLDLLAPPYYLSPGTPSWIIQSFTYKPGCSTLCLPSKP